MAPKKVTINRCVALTHLSDPQISPDGEAIVFSKRFLSEDGTDRNNVICMIDPATEETVELTDGPLDRCPRWSADGDRIAFVTDDDGPQIAFVTLDGEVEMLTEMQMDPGDIEVIPHLGRISFLSTVPEGKRERERRERGDDARVHSQAEHPKRIYSACPRTGNVRAESPADCAIWSWAWIDHKNAVVVHTPEAGTEDACFEPRIGILSVEDDRIEDFGVELTFPDQLTVSPGGSRVALVGNDRGVPYGAEAWVIDLETGDASNLTPELEGNVGFLRWRNDSRLILGIEEGVQTRLYTVQADGTGIHSVCGDLPATVEGLSVAEDGSSVAVVAEDVDKSPEIWSGDIESGQVQKLSSVNIPGDELRLGECTTRTWTSTGDLEIEGLVTLPVGYEEGKKYPTVAVVHGGPWGRHQREIRLGKRQLFANNGYVVLEVNYRGSSGYGLDFMMANVGDWMGADFEDHLTGLDMLIDEGIADPDRLAIYGASYGGYAATWAISQTDRFQAAASRSGLMDLYSAYGQTDERALVRVYFGTTPYDDPEAYRSRSPLHFAENIDTPLLLLHGEDDSVVDTGQSVQMYRALRHFGVETELVTYPREGHRFAEPLHEADLRERVLGWLDKYLKG